MNKYLLLGLICFFTSLPLAAQNDSAGIFHSPENILKFADYLYCQKDYLRAISEYESLLKFQNSDTIKFKIALGFSKMGKSKEAEDRFNRLATGSTFSDEARLELYKSKFFTNDIASLRQMYNEKSLLPGKYIESVKSLYYTSFLFDNATLPGKEEFIEAFPVFARSEMGNFYLRKSNPPYKSPVKAAILSAIFPGLGKAYAGEWGDGLTSLIVTGFLSYVSYDNLKAHHNFRGYLFGGLAALFYAGNVYGSIAQAQIYNAQVDFTFTTDLKFFLNSHNYFLPQYEKFCK
ncbi:MAG: hypothetical protein HF300_12035 [Ignavibacteria bacterium]|jgi:TM2 domain-containing membrane protein YozV|nr:hypothetical protein [Ignavibacteria bacterium]MCU7499822.1 hypothetical protein [Ignavibacteria bacterium]MCU7513285.1 hypothetical protein [Ignavibacteria bacterium]MCU7522152.1 hypothetical protein [Ignavibacteria bacterium]MCU7525842.1 hypothetical protein [Ignavibacteria bacterium]